ncbi:SAM-dependent methyltransferase [Nocardiopsis xinjiangensis]|uniref:SAM-dependent methyltransferase n=1 Tax=Nocardiopsis xinjiangensis TaxID=124285 RepID=UPI0003486971|nr:SAM-dependent methyltransferase [Nocardiopsis xinjiangensis]
MTNPSQHPIDASVPHSARVWNYWLGGKDNYPVDREAGEKFLETFPGIAQEARAARAFLTRAVRYLAEEAGIRQFLDIGTGLPTADNTHEVAQTLRPDARILYVDNDPLVLTHARALLTSTEEGYADYLHASLEEPKEILAAARERLDFDEPIGLIIIGVLAHVSGYGRAKDIVRTLRDALPAGSHLIISDGTHSHQANVEAQEDYNESGAVAYNLRSKEEIAGFFEGLEVVDPGLTTVTRWRCEETEFGTPPEVDGYGGVGRKS